MLFACKTVLPRVSNTTAIGFDRLLKSLVCLLAVFLNCSFAFDLLLLLEIEAPTPSQKKFILVHVMCVLS